MSINDAQQVVEIVSDPTRELTDRFHLFSIFCACWSCFSRSSRSLTSGVMAAAPIICSCASFTGDIVIDTSMRRPSFPTCTVSNRLILSPRLNFSTMSGWPSA